MDWKGLAACRLLPTSQAGLFSVCRWNSPQGHDSAQLAPVQILFCLHLLHQEAFESACPALLPFCVTPRAHYRGLKLSCMAQVLGITYRPPGRASKLSGGMNVPSPHQLEERVWRLLRIFPQCPGEHPWNRELICVSSSLSIIIYCMPAGGPGTLRV